jgi:predicted enzyme related to lactoylglutathione lyase
MFPPGVPCWVAQLSPESDEAKQFYAAIFDRTFDNIAPLAASQAFRSDRRAGGADRNSRASRATKEVIRLLKRYLTRELFPLLHADLQQATASR